MRPGRARQKKKECLKHRQTYYEKALDRLIEGEADPEYVNMRFNKLKQIRDKH